MADNVSTTGRGAAWGSKQQHRVAEGLTGVTGDEGH